MRITAIRLLFILVIISVFNACNNRYTRQSYTEYLTPGNFTSSDSLRYKTILENVSSNDVVWVEANRRIIMINDSVLNYSIRYGGLGASTSIKYFLQDSLMIIDSIDIYDRDHFQEFAEDIFNHGFLYSKDSLVDLINNDTYFSNKYIDRK